MMPTMATLLKTVTGKMLIGLTAVTMGVGVAAAGGADVPMLVPATSGEGSAGESSEGDSSDEGTTGASSDEGSSEELSEESEGESSEEASQEATSGESNHGSVVSDFTQRTELTGCEKGQATAAVARGDVDPGSDTLDADLAPHLERCQNSDADDEGGSQDDAVDPGDDDSSATGWKELRDAAKVDFDEARQAFVEACGDDDEGDEGLDVDGGTNGAGGETDTSEAADSDADDGELSSECRLLKDEWKQTHRAGKDEWKAARDVARAGQRDERSELRAAEREEREADRHADRPGEGKGKGKAKGKNDNG